MLLLLAFIGIQQWRIRSMLRWNRPAAGIGKSDKYSNLFNAMPIVYIQMEGDLRRETLSADALYCDVNSVTNGVHPPVSRRSDDGSANCSLPDDRVHAAHKNRTDREPDHHLSLLLQNLRHLLRSGDQPLVPRRVHIDIFCLDGGAAQAQQKLDSINLKLAMALDVADIVPWKMGPAQRVDPVRREQIGARPNARRRRTPTSQVPSKAISPRSTRKTANGCAAPTTT